MGPKIVFASGSPFDDVDFGNGVVGHANQGNNMYLFPGIGLGTLLSGARNVSDGMLHAAATRLASFMTDEKIEQGIIFPPTESIREITREVAAAVGRKAVEEDLAEGYREIEPKHLRRMSESQMSEYIAKNMWWPSYSPIIYSPSSTFGEVVKSG